MLIANDNFTPTGPTLSQLEQERMAKAVLEKCVEMVINYGPERVLQALDSIEADEVPAPAVKTGVQYFGDGNVPYATSEVKCGFGK